MAATTFQKLLDQGLKSGQIPAQTQKAKNWFRERARKTYVKPGSLMKEDVTRLKNKPSLYEMFHFFYDPKTKNQLPYWDAFPLIFKIAEYPDRFLGINLHYLSPVLRAKLMDALYTTVNNKNYNETTKLRISYAVLSSAVKFAPFKPCIKMYLKAHVRSRFMKIYANEWDIALMLPTESFQKAPKTKVWRDSRAKI
jgi:hypothetical protein